MKTRGWRCWSAYAWRRGAMVGTGGSPSAAARCQARCQADLLEAGERRHTQRWLCAAICQAWRLPHSVANQPWQHDGWAVAHAKELLLPLLLAQFRAGQTYSLLFSAFSPSLCPFFFPFILCVTPLTPTHLCFFCLSCSFYLWQSAAAGPHALLSATRSHRRPCRQNPGGNRFKVGISLIPFHRILLLSFLSLHHLFLLLLPLSDNTPTQMCMHL